MKTIRVGGGPVAHLRVGDLILAAALTTDTQLITVPLEAFRQVQQGYGGAHNEVRAAKSRQSTAEIELAALDAVQDQAVDAKRRFGAIIS